MAKHTKKHTKKSGKKVKEIHFRRAESGHLIARHEHHPSPDGMPVKDEEHIVPDEEAGEHLNQFLPQQQEESPAVGAPAPQAGGMLGQNE